jgi:RNA polymerase sigma-70 factor (ECF subfamily)
MSEYQLTETLPTMADEEQMEVAPAGPSEDSILFGKFLAGDDVAAIKVFRKYNRPLTVYCMKMLGNIEQAQDVTQEIWERVVRLRERPMEVHTPLGFLIRIARNLCLNHLRGKKNMVPLEEAIHPAYAMPEPTDLEDLVLSSLDKLSHDYREVLILNFYCGYRFDEIAEMLGKSPDAIWMRASRARAQLRKIVASAMEGAASGSGNNGTRINASKDGDAQ